MVLAGLSLHTNTPGILVGESKAKWLPYNGHPVPSEPPYTVSLKMKKAKQSKKKKQFFIFYKFSHLVKHLAVLRSSSCLE